MPFIVMMSVMSSTWRRSMEMPYTPMTRKISSMSVTREACERREAEAQTCVLKRVSCPTKHRV